MAKDPNIQKLREEVAELERKLANTKAMLDFSVRDCRHVWSNPENADIYHKGYRIPGDPPGTMGIDWRGPVDVEPRTEKRWKRECQKCGEVEYTSNTTEEVIKHPKF